MINLSEDEMLDLWKTRIGLMQARRDCTIEREDGIDLDGELLVEIQQWYATLLATAPVEWLPTEDLAAATVTAADDTEDDDADDDSESDTADDEDSDDTTVTDTAITTSELEVTTDAAGVVTVVLPSRFVRPVAWHVEGWACDVVTFHAPDSVVARQQAVEWLRGGGARPVAVLHADCLKLYSVAPGDTATVDKAISVVRPDDGSYQFSQEALSTMPSMRLGQQ